MKVLIIDDESLARDLLKSYLKGEEDIELVGECANGFEGMKAIQEQEPDLVFLDVQMPKLNGFEMLELLDNPPFIIFATAHDEFAIKAFEANAVDYLLKPFSKERCRQALDKFRERFQEGESGKEIAQKLVEYKDEQPSVLDRIVVRTGAKIKIILPENIKYLESQDDYVMIYTQEGKFLKQKTMTYFERHLDAKDFVRIHRSYIVRIEQIAQIELFGKDTHIAALKDGSKLSVSRSGYSRLKEVLDF
jgi:two-component system, LytTR family, response regulator